MWLLSEKVKTGENYIQSFYINNQIICTNMQLYKIYNIKTNRII